MISPRLPWPFLRAALLAPRLAAAARPARALEADIADRSGIGPLHLARPAENPAR